MTTANKVDLRKAKKGDKLRLRCGKEVPYDGILGDESADSYWRHVYVFDGRTKICCHHNGRLYEDDSSQHDVVEVIRAKPTPKPAKKAAREARTWRRWAILWEDTFSDETFLTRAAARHRARCLEPEGRVIRVNVWEER